MEGKKIYNMSWEKKNSIFSQFNIERKPASQAIKEYVLDG